MTAPKRYFIEALNITTRIIADDTTRQDLEDQIGGAGDMEGLALRNFKAAIITDATTDRTLSADDRGRVLRFTNAGAITVTLPDNLEAGFSCTIIQRGAGQITFVAAGGGALTNRQSHTKTAAQHAAVSLMIDSNVDLVSAAWLLLGDTAA